jgi:quercetin dioxygenase-like cupin family protein
MKKDINVKIKRAHLGGQRWEAVDLLEYKAVDQAPFRDVTRQVLFEDPNLLCQWRYFEVAPHGHTTLERHHHAHAVMVLKGAGHCLVGEEIYILGQQDLVTIPSMTWHQFRAEAQPLGFLCLVNAERDKPQLPTAQDLEAICLNPVVAEFIRTST